MVNCRIRRRRTLRERLCDTIRTLQCGRGHSSGDGHGRGALYSGMMLLEVWCAAKSLWRKAGRANRWAGKARRARWVGELRWWDAWTERAESVGRHASHQAWGEGRAGVLGEALVERIEVAVFGRGRLFAVTDLLGGSGRGGIVRNWREACWGGFGVWTVGVWAGGDSREGRRGERGNSGVVG